MDEDVFVERRFELADQEVVARFFKPMLAPGGEYQCRWQICWPNRERKSGACGIDGVQALMLAMRTVHSELVESEEQRAGRLTYLEQHDLDLPPTWGTGPLYDAGPESE